jgi:predicted nuclease of predicted toxin-antitoxin system
VKIVVDMNLPTLWVDALRSAGIEAVHWSTVGSPNSPDEDIVSYADSNESIILTRDLDFGEYVATSGRNGPSIVQLRARRGVPALHAKLVIKALLETREALEQGALVTIDADRVRVRLLPTPSWPI